MRVSCAASDCPSENTSCHRCHRWSAPSDGHPDDVAPNVTIEQTIYHIGYTEKKEQKKMLQFN